MCDCSKWKCLTNIILCTSTLTTLEGALKIEVHALSSFFGYKDQQRTTFIPKNIFKDTSTVVGIHNVHA